MTKLIETDEEVEKARKALIPGGSKKMQRRVFNMGAEGRYFGPKTSERLSRAHAYLGRRSRRVKKSNEPTALEALDSAIEKARGLLPKGGMMAGALRMERDMHKRVARGPKIKSASERKANMDRAKREFSAVGRLRRRALSRAGK